MEMSPFRTSWVEDSAFVVASSTLEQLATAVAASAADSAIDHLLTLQGVGHDGHAQTGVVSAQISCSAVALNRFGQEDTLQNAPPQGVVPWSFRELRTVSICLNRRRAQLSTAIAADTPHVHRCPLCLRPWFGRFERPHRAHL